MRGNSNIYSKYKERSGLTLFEIAVYIPRFISEQTLKINISINIGPLYNFTSKAKNIRVAKDMRLTDRKLFLTDR